MEINIEQVEGKVAVTILELHGNLDASNFEEVIDKARSVYESGARDLLIDLGDVDFMSSSGIVALHSIALLMRGEQPHDLESGWEVFHAIPCCWMIKMAIAPNLSRILKVYGIHCKVWGLDLSN